MTVVVRSATELLCLASGTAPIFTMAAQEDSYCAMCGMEIRIGQPCAAFQPNFDFNDWNALAKGTSYQCGYCKAANVPRFMRSERRLIVSRNGLTPISKGNDARRLLDLVPEPPFYVVYSTAKPVQLKHIHWMAPINYSRDVFAMQFNHRKLWIRRDAMVGAAEVCKEERRRMGRFPFMFDLEMEHESFGDPLPHAAGGFKELLGRLTLGELWLLGLQTVNFKNSTTDY